MDLTKHANIRSRQRGFSEQMLEIILRCGREQLVKGGAVKISLGRKESQQIIREAKKLIQLVDKNSIASVIVKDDQIVTMYKHH